MAPCTDWTPRDGAVAKFRDPTSSGFYSTNLIRSMVGYNGYGQIPIWTYVGSNNYNSFTNGVQTNATFGVIGSAQVQARRAVRSLRLRF